MKRYEEMVEQVKKWQAAGIEDGAEIVYKIDDAEVRLMAGSGRLILCLVIVDSDGLQYDAVYQVRSGVLLCKSEDIIHEYFEDWMKEELSAKPKIYLVIQEDSEAIFISSTHPDDPDSYPVRVNDEDFKTIDETVDWVKNSMEVSGLIEVEIIDQR